jgi:RNA polymerase sigma-54 factor
MHEVSLRQQQQQKLMMTTAMQQAFLVLQLPLLELAEWVRSEIENNPILEMQLPESDTHSSFAAKKGIAGISRLTQSDFLENTLSTPISLFDHLLTQARYHFSDPKDLLLAQWIIGHLNESGFLAMDDCDFASVKKGEEILAIVQSFDPPGVAARTLKESLLIQLRLKHKEHTVAYKIIAECFEDLLHNRFPLIAKEMNISLEDLSQIVEREIAPLDLHPGQRFGSHYPRAIIPDLYFLCTDDVWKIEVNDTFLPTFHLAPSYRSALKENQLNAEENSYVRKQLCAGKWIRHIINKRKVTLLKLGTFLLKKQARFFQEGILSPLKMAEAAAELNVHESTIARAIANKYLSCPQGIFALKDFFCHGLPKQETGSISHHALLRQLKELIAKEDKKKPYSDAAIQKLLSQSGISCARRTVTKYRRLLHIATASHRKKWN